MTPLQKIQKAVYASCPELLELSFGCRVVTGTPTDQTARTIGNERIKPDKEGTKYGIGQWLIFEDWNCSMIMQILGHPIQLHHVLRTINYSERNWKYEDAGLSLELQEGKDYIELLTNLLGWKKWDLTQDLANQSEETISFIAQLLA